MRRSDAEAVCRDELWEATSPRSRSMSPQGRGRSPCRQEKVSRRPHMCSQEREKIGRAWKIIDREQQIIESTRDALLKEEEKESRAMRVMSMRVEEIIKDVRDIRCDRCKDEG